jgi:LAO/AO transport system kinase
VTAGSPEPKRSGPAGLLRAASSGDHAALGRLLSLVERGGERGREVARLAYRAPLSASGDHAPGDHASGGDGSQRAPLLPYTVGLTGAPGAGKSTITDRLLAEALGAWPGPEPSGQETVDQVAVLAIDPTSPFSGGAILGDRVRMQAHATDPRIFIRSMASRGHLGGLAAAVPDAVRVLGAAGFPLVLLETVGVGQAEVDVASAADTTVVVVTPGWGDAMQANKAGLLEVADLFVINKADRPGVRQARRDLEQMLDLSAAGAWRPPIVETVASSGEGVSQLWSVVADHRGFLMSSGELDRRRQDRLLAEVRRVVIALLSAEADALLAEAVSPGGATSATSATSGAAAGTPANGGRDLRPILDAVSAGQSDPYEAAEELMARLAPVIGRERSR